jgi:hypothetical protein
LNVAEDVKCSECERLRESSLQAQRAFTFYQPMHSGYRPKSRWFKDDRQTRSRLEEAYNLAEAKYHLHRAEHSGGQADGRDVARSISIVLRNGRLKP